jgi:secretion/DNA translocation related TadE-like protein
VTRRARLRRARLRRARLRRLTGDRGSATIWVLTCCVLLAVVAGVGTARGLAVLARHRAESAADLAALAAAGQIGVSEHECAAARQVAAQNGAALHQCSLRLSPDGRSGMVSVAVSLPVRLPIIGAQTVAATARAARLPPRSAARPAALPPRDEAQVRIVPKGVQDSKGNATGNASGATHVMLSHARGEG